MERIGKTSGSLCLAGAGFLWGWSFLFFFSSQAVSSISLSFLTNDILYLGSTLVAALLAVRVFWNEYDVRQLRTVGNAAFALMLAGSVLLAISMVARDSGFYAMAGKIVAGPGQGLSWIAWTTVLSRFDIECAERSFLQWIPILVGVVLASTLGNWASVFPPQLFNSVLMVLLPVASWVFFCRALSLSSEPKRKDASVAAAEGKGDDVKSIVWLFANLSFALAVIMVVWAAFLFQHQVSVEQVKVVFSLGAFVALPIVWFALRVTRRLAPSSLYRWAVPIMAFAVVLDFIAPAAYVWCTCLCLSVVSVGFEGMYHLVFIYVSKRFSQRAMLAASLGVVATTVGGMIGSTVWAVCLSQVSSADAGKILLVALFVLVLCWSCAPRFGGVLGLNGGGVEGEVSSQNSSPVEKKCELAANAYGLTPREREVLFLLAQGRSRAFIREALFISKGTVDTHVHHIYSKMGIGSKDELVKMVLDGEDILAS